MTRNGGVLVKEVGVWAEWTRRLEGEEARRLVCELDSRAPSFGVDLEREGGNESRGVDKVWSTLFDMYYYCRNADRRIMLNVDALLLPSSNPGEHSIDRRCCFYL